MFYLACAQFRRGLDITSFEPDSFSSTGHFSITDRTLPSDFVDQCIITCNRCYMCVMRKNDIIWELKRFILLILGYIVCKTRHVRDDDALCIRRVMHPLTSQQKNASLLLFGRVLTKTCPQRLAHFTKNEITHNMLLVIKRLPTLTECLHNYSTDYFSKRHLLSTDAFQVPFKLNRSMFENIVRPYFYPMFDEFDDLFEHFLNDLKTYLYLLLGMKFKTQFGKKMLISVPHSLTYEQQHIYTVNKLYDLILPEHDLV